jgi:hypothetical protein
VASEFKNLIQGVPKERIGLFGKDKPKYDSNNIWVFFHVFEPYAKAEANQQVAESQLKRLQNEIGSDEIWTVVKAFYTAVFFFYTKEQVTENEKNGIRKKLSLRYLELIKPYDEFNYFKEGDFTVTLDSKENFEKNYSSNWYNYFA